MDYISKPGADKAAPAPGDNIWKDIDGAVLKALPPKNWTIAIDLTESGLPDKLHPGGSGVENQLPSLKALAAETEGKSVNFVVHAERPVDDKMHPCADSEKTLAAKYHCTLYGIAGYQSVTEDYLIHDGKIDRLPDAHFKIPAQDFSSILKEAGQLAPAKHLGLIIASHGGGSSGLGTNLGNITLDETINSVKLGLLFTEHNKLDLLDFDACDMAELKVLSASAQVAKDVVASAGYEQLTYTNDGQNLSASMKALLAKDNMNGLELGQTIVSEAASGSNGSGESVATPTLANFDMNKIEPFVQSLDHFGKALASTAKDKSNLQLIESEIDRTPIPETGYDETDSHGRDLRSFAANVQTDLKTHRFAGDTSSLQNATENMLSALKPLVTENFGDPIKGYDKLGGFTASVPGSEIMDNGRVAHEITALHQISSQLKLVNDANPGMSFQSHVVRFLKKEIGDIQPELARFYPEQMKELRQAERSVEKATTLPDYRKALVTMQQVAANADNGPLGGLLDKTMKRAANAVQLNYFNSPQEQITPNWDNFVGLMSEQQR